MLCFGNENTSCCIVTDNFNAKRHLEELLSIITFLIEDLEVNKFYFYSRNKLTNDLINNISKKTRGYYKNIDCIYATRNMKFYCEHINKFNKDYSFNKMSFLPIKYVDYNFKLSLKTNLINYCDYTIIFISKKTTLEELVIKYDLKNFKVKRSDNFLVASYHDF